MSDSYRLGLPPGHGPAARPVRPGAVFLIAARSCKRVPGSRSADADRAAPTATIPENGRR